MAAFNNDHIPLSTVVCCESWHHPLYTCTSWERWSLDDTLSLHEYYRSKASLDEHGPSHPRHICSPFELRRDRSLLEYASLQSDGPLLDDDTTFPFSLYTVPHCFVTSDCDTSPPSSYMTPTHSSLPSLHLKVPNLLACCPNLVNVVLHG